MSMKIETKAGSVDLNKLQEDLQRRQGLLSQLSTLLKQSELPNMPPSTAVMAGLISEQLGNAPEETAKLISGMLERSHEATMQQVLRNIR